MTRDEHLASNKSRMLRSGGVSEDSIWMMELDRRAYMGTATAAEKAELKQLQLRAACAQRASAKRGSIQSLDQRAAEVYASREAGQTNAPRPGSANTTPAAAGSAGPVDRAAIFAARGEQPKESGR